MEELGARMRNCFPRCFLILVQVPWLPKGWCAQYPFHRKLATGNEGLPPFSRVVVQKVGGVLYDVRVLYLAWLPHFIFISLVICPFPTILFSSSGSYNLIIFLRTSPFTGYLPLSRPFHIIYMLCSTPSISTLLRVHLITQ